MRKIVLVLAFIITSLPVTVLSKDLADVPFLVIPGHQTHGPVLCFNYSTIYKTINGPSENMPWNRGHNEMQQKYEQWIVENVGYLMTKWNCWYVFIKDPYTDHTAPSVTLRIQQASKVIDITELLIWNLEHSINQEGYGVLRSGPNFYVLNSQYLNEWAFHLIPNH